MYAKLQKEIALLNVPDSNTRLENLKKLLLQETEKPTVFPQYANNHIHTFYSFSPYSPTAAVYMARAYGLETAGIMDHDSIGGAKEFRAAGKIAGLGTTCGMECRADFSATPLCKRKINNPDQNGIAYMAIHSVPEASIDILQNTFEPYRNKRNIRNRKMTDNINSIISPFGIHLDFDTDIVPLSFSQYGGSITERHLLYALSLKIIKTVGVGRCAEFLEKKLHLTLSEKQKSLLCDYNNPHLSYDLLGVLKSSLVEKIYIPATDECMPISDLTELCNKANAILCYPYLGDVTNSATGDKKAAKFEDDYLDELFDMLKKIGIKAITYMPSRNTPEQLSRLQNLCRAYNMIEISGEDVNSSRQSMICKQLELPQFKHLVDMAWKLVKRES